MTDHIAGQVARFARLYVLAAAGSIGALLAAGTDTAKTVWGALIAALLPALGEVGLRQANQVQPVDSLPTVGD